ncbi:hypothetical protein GPECTOR_15g331 [Gonium pectorale]|uniref:Uncharacterized protein n=1 Tax=Gonium pectorale TaxID=33097 RepID=A0A150GLI3_GONPE|nr:hypothetical protein GPECTOR_15g331 [Gonium pectorale]|eukprot:KXZ50647.1 hypothetical protein GPECTOR_15g331 [Gonium pectorale]
MSSSDAAPGKRPADADAAHADDDGVAVGAPAAKAQRLGGGERVAALPVGANLVEVDGKACTHEVAWPPDQQGSTLPPPQREGPPARVYPFKIDPFQQVAVNCLEAGHSVMVAAHTSAGKTVVAEYAFAMALRDKTRVVYTSPLKALSNQKYRELAEEFVDVGLMTGDVTINPNASCLVMTTEILRSMLYRGSEVVREVQLIVYDEIHYLRDKERGVVWEESIILAPRQARFAFLSATIPNAREFAEWVAKTHRSPCHVVYTDYRPTPLQHYLFPAGGDGLYMVVDERGIFKDDNFQKAVAVLTDTDPSGKGSKGGKGGASGAAAGPAGGPDSQKSDIFKLVRMIMERNYDPVIVFSFSKRECEALAAQMAPLELNSDDEKALVANVYWSAMECLSQDDQRLPQISAMLPMLQRGIGVHHSGLLPIVKEVVEILFQEGLLKCLFATETFSTGLNMPAKTVVFTNVKKYDGGAFRWITSGEYIQMSGRAGRRGLDDRGVVILMLDTRLEPPVARDMIKGAPDVLYSAFHLGYNMLLSLMRVEGAEPEQLMAASFRQFQTERALPALEARVKALEAARDGISIPDEPAVRSYYALLDQLVSLRAGLRGFVNSPAVCLPFLQPGRLVRLLPQPPELAQPMPDFSQPAAAGAAPHPEASTSAGAGSGGGGEAVMAEVTHGVWGAVVNFERVGGRKDAADGNGAGGKGGKKGGGGGGGAFIVDVLVNVAPPPGGAASGGSLPRGTPARLLPPGDKSGVPMVVTFPLSQVDALSTVRIYLQKDLRPLDARRAAVSSLAEALARLAATRKGGRVPLLDPEDDLKVADKAARKTQSKLESVEGLLAEHPLAAALPAAELRGRLAALQRRGAADEAVAAARREAKAAASLILKDELKARQRVLRRLAYVDEEGVVTVKGRVAAGLSCGDELVLCELVFAGAFNAMSLEAMAAACSCFVYQEKGGPGPGPKLREELVGTLAAVKDAARRVAKVELDCKMALDCGPHTGAASSTDLEEYLAKFKPDLMEPVAAWVRGSKFADVAKMTTVFEGSLVRAVRRLEELLRQLAEALRGVGEAALAERFEAARERVKRDIIFAASLYL